MKHVLVAGGSGISGSYLKQTYNTKNFTFFSSKVVISYKNSTILYVYLSLLLVGSNFYYANLFN